MACGPALEEVLVVRVHQDLLAAGGTECSGQLGTSY